VSTNLSGVIRDQSAHRAEFEHRLKGFGGARSAQICSGGEPQIIKGHRTRQDVPSQLKMIIVAGLVNQSVHGRIGLMACQSSGDLNAASRGPVANP